jgi:prepilin-type N-terminal cleavage/methylation domain-containing protein
MTYVILSQHELTARQALRLPTGHTRIPHARAGMTLIELLIVIVILTTLVAAAIPILSPSSNDRRIREASRAINTYITAAQTKAMELRRPVGVALKKLSADSGNADDNGVCLELYQVEQPPAFSGFDETSAVRISFATTPYQVRMQFVRRDQTTGKNLSAGWVPDSIPEKMLRPGDRIEVAGNVYRFLEPLNPELYSSETAAIVDHPQPFYTTYEASKDDKSYIFFAQVENDSGQMLNCEVDSEGYLVKPQLLTMNGLMLTRYETIDGKNQPVSGSPPFWTQPKSYKILRQPSPTSAEPYQLPEGIAIDLRASSDSRAWGNSRNFYHNAEHQQPKDRNNNHTPIMIMFTPEGTVHRVVLNVGPGLSDLSGFPDVIVSDPVVSSIFLLIGPRENIPVTPWTSDNTLKNVGINQLSNTELEELKTSINWLNPESRWVVIGAQSGRVVSTENAFVDPSAVLAVATTGNNPIPESSQQLRNLQIDAAREFAREMTQAGDL